MELDSFNNRLSNMVRKKKYWNKANCLILRSGSSNRIRIKAKKKKNKGGNSRAVPSISHTDVPMFAVVMV